MQLRGNTENRLFLLLSHRSTASGFETQLYRMDSQRHTVILHSIFKLFSGTLNHKMEAEEELKGM